MAETKNKVVTVESLSALHDYNKDTYMSITTITIPAGGWLRGDVNGDGKVNTKDAMAISQYLNGNNVNINEMGLLCADVNNDGNVDEQDMQLISQQYSENDVINIEDVLGNWISNPNYNSGTEDMQYYTDIEINNMSLKDSAIITIISDNDYDKNFFNYDYDKNFFQAMCIDGAIRVYAKSLPIPEIKAIVQYGNGNKSDIVMVNDSSKILSVANGGTGVSKGSQALANFFNDGETIISSYQYGDTLPAAGTVGRIFFKKLSE